MAEQLWLDVSLWSADLANLASEIARIDPFADGYHLDVCDGHFAPVLLFFPDLVARLRTLTAKPFHVHLMATRPMDLLPAFLDAGGGPNTVKLTVGGDVALGQDLATTVLTGAGNDLLSLISRSIFCDGSVRLAADLGAGFDLFNGLVVADVNPTGLVDVAVGLGASTDDCNLQYRGQINGDVKLLVDGADGNDTIQAYIIPTVGSVGTLQAELYGGLNNDDLSFLMWGLQGQLPALTTNLLVDGGPNFDVAWVVPNVPVLNIEELHIAPEP